MPLKRSLSLPVPLHTVAPVPSNNHPSADDNFHPPTPAPSQLGAALKAYQHMLSFGGLWREVTLNSLQPPQHLMTEISAITRMQSLSTTNLQRLKTTLGTLTPWETAFLSQVLALNPLLVHMTSLDAINAIRQSGTRFSNQWLTQSGAYGQTPYGTSKGKHNTTSHDATHIANTDFVFFYFEFSGEPGSRHNSRFGDTELNSNATDSGLFELGWVMLYDLLTPKAILNTTKPVHFSLFTQYNLFSPNVHIPASTGHEHVEVYSSLPMSTAIPMLESDYPPSTLTQLSTDLQALRGNQPPNWQDGQQRFVRLVTTGPHHTPRLTAGDPQDTVFFGPDILPGIAYETLLVLRLASDAAQGVTQLHHDLDPSNPLWLTTLGRLLEPQAMLPQSVLVTSPPPVTRTPITAPRAFNGMTVIEQYPPSPESLVKALLCAGKYHALPVPHTPQLLRNRIVQYLDQLSEPQRLHIQVTRPMLTHLKLPNTNIGPPEIRTFSILFKVNVLLVALDHQVYTPTLTKSPTTATVTIHLGSHRNQFFALM
ncbi:MAG: hypothetical protein DRR19_02735 [Candidatus Parabeggiatoa sp. nov. 1]|nr:MAG: hypothetical protein DRR19_02735 [Gammaproteobacteria bacterium]